MKTMHRVVIVGRTNVGKSTLFNRLSTSARSITFDVAGVTRDFIRDQVQWLDRTFELVDTGGISFRKGSDQIMQQVREKALSMIDQADIILFMVDGSIGLLPEDHEIASLLRKWGKKVILVINKSDAKTTQDHRHEFDRLGFDTSIEVSAIHSKAIGDLLDLICKLLPETAKHEVEELRFRVVLLGKPNVGKSSLMNLLLNQERSIVNPEAGTTREPISEKITFYKEDILLTDTAGVRRKRSIDEPLETMMVRTSFKALDQADIALLLIDESEAQISDQEWKLAFYAFENYKALIILFNKDDLADEQTRKSLRFGNEVYEHFLEKIPQLFISCKTGKNVGKILPLVRKVWENYSQQFPSEDLTVMFKDALLKRPLYHKTMLLKVHRVQQVVTAPITLLLIVNESAWFGPSQLKYFEHVMRKKYDLTGVPIKFLVRKA